MQHLFFEDWKNKRVQKIKNIFGNDWFVGKSILDMGCHHGDVGAEFLKLGAYVEFSDARKENLEKISVVDFKTTTHVCDQEQPYRLKQYDLLLHLGLLYNIKNWRQDLECALADNKMMILETMVLPEKGLAERTIEVPNNKTNDHGSYGNHISLISERCIEEHLTNLGCKFIKFSNHELNSHGWMSENIMIHHVYDWTYDTCKKVECERIGNTYNIYHNRRMWLVLK